MSKRDGNHASASHEAGCVARVPDTYGGDLTCATQMKDTGGVKNVMVTRSLPAAWAMNTFFSDTLQCDLASTAGLPELLLFFAVSAAQSGHDGGDTIDDRVRTLFERF